MIIVKRIKTKGYMNMNAPEISYRVFGNEDITGLQHYLDDHSGDNFEFEKL